MKRSRSGRDPVEVGLFRRRAIGPVAGVPADIREIRQFRGSGPNEQRLEKRDDTANREVDDDLMVPHALSTLDRAEVPYNAIMTIAHASKSAISEHGGTMHSQTIPSNLGGSVSKKIRVLTPATPKIRGSLRETGTQPALRLKPRNGTAHAPTQL
jgi:hypothetical protein